VRGRSDVAVVVAGCGGAWVAVPAATAVGSWRNEPVESAEGKPTGGEDGAALAAMRAATSR
jgi:hypothetical protein